MEGEKVMWYGINRIHRGVIVGRHKRGYIVQTETGKKVIVHPKSFIHVKTDKQEPGKAPAGPGV